MQRKYKMFIFALDYRRCIMTHNDEKKHRCIATEWWWGTNLSFILEDGIGIVEMQFDNNMPNVAYIKGLIIDHRERRKGYATQLMGICHAYARDNKKMFMELSVNKNEDWLVEWYKRCGFNILSFDDNEYLMIKWI